MRELTAQEAHFRAVLIEEQTRGALLMEESRKTRRMAIVLMIASCVLSIVALFAGAVLILGD